MVGVGLPLEVGGAVGEGDAVPLPVAVGLPLRVGEPEAEGDAVVEAVPLRVPEAVWDSVHETVAVAVPLGVADSVPDLVQRSGGRGGRPMGYPNAPFRKQQVLGQTSAAFNACRIMLHGIRNFFE